MEFFVKIGGTRFSTFRKNRGYTFFDFQESKKHGFLQLFRHKLERSNCLKSQLYASENWELPFRETVPFTERLRHRVPWACFLQK